MLSLGRHGVTAIRWSAASTLARFALQLGAQVLLARTLGPEVFGVFAIGLLVLTFASFVSGFGFSWSLLQRSTVVDDDIRFAWTWQLLVGLLTSVGVYLLAPLLAAYFREPRSQQVIEWLSLACLLTAATAPANSLLQRELNFRAIGLIQLGSYAVGYLAVGVPMALQGRAEASLVAAWLVQAGVCLVASYALKRHAIWPLFWYSGAPAALSTGRAVFATNVVNWALNNMDRVLIGRLLNTQALGLYNLAYNLATLPNTLLLGALQPAFMAAGAKLQTEQQRLGRIYLQMLATVLVLGVPAFMFLGLVSADLVRVLYGPAWAESGWVLGILFMSMPAYVIWGLSTPVLWNTGRKHQEFALQLPLVAVGALGFYALAGQGLRMAASVAAGLLVLRAVVIGLAALRALQLHPLALLPHAGRGLLLGSLCAAAVWLGQRATSGLDSAWWSLLASGLLTLAAMAGALACWPGRLLGEPTIDMLLRFFPQLTHALHRCAAPRAKALGEPQG